MISKKYQESLFARFTTNLKESTREEIAGWLFASPWIIGFLVFTLGPMLYSLYLSFTRYDMFTPPRWIGLENFITMFTIDNLVLHSLKITTIYALVSVPLTLVVGFFLALLLNQKVKGLSFWRTLFYLPSIVTGVAVYILWVLVLNPQFGLFNSLLAQIGIQGPNWLGDPDWALLSLVLIHLWGVGGTMLIYLAGLQGIPTELYEAAEVDGANTIQKLINITIPMMVPVIFFNLVMGIITSMQSFNIAYIMTKGGPAWSTYFFMLHLYTKGFEELKMGYASALAWVLFLYILVWTVIVFRRYRKTAEVEN